MGAGAWELQEQGPVACARSVVGTSLKWPRSLLQLAAIPLPVWWHRTSGPPASGYDVRCFVEEFFGVRVGWKLCMTSGSGACGCERVS